MNMKLKGTLGKCLKCKRSFDKVSPNTEHIIPDGLQGPYLATNVLCSDCNENLGSKLDRQFVKSFKSLSNVYSSKNKIVRFLYDDIYFTGSFFNGKLQLDKDIKIADNRLKNVSKAQKNSIVSKFKKAIKKDGVLKIPMNFDNEILMFEIAKIQAEYLVATNKVQKEEDINIALMILRQLDITSDEAFEKSLKRTSGVMDLFSKIVLPQIQKGYRPKSFKEQQGVNAIQLVPLNSVYFNTKVNFVFIDILGKLRILTPVLSSANILYLLGRENAMKILN
ncbi:HNH endonuclease [Lactobacillus buchneri]|nr:HNH endonuclease [Lentilactobacillus buchneri]